MQIRTNRSELFAAMLGVLLVSGCAARTGSIVPTAVAPPASDGLLRWPDLIGRERPVADAMIPYGTENNQQISVWLPEEQGPHKTVLMVHGGCWTTEIADLTLMDWIADDLRQDGYAVWNIDYRGVDVGGGYPNTFLDAAAAADALREHAAEYHLDLGNIVAIGHSAGGHLALWLASRHKLLRDSPLFRDEPLPIAHVVSLGGLPDLELTAATPENGCGTEVIDQLTGGHFSDTSIPHLLPIGVPQDHITGQQDRIIPLNLTRDFVAKARAAGDHSAIAEPGRTGHVELIAPESAAWTLAKEAIMKAFVR
jgi:acetyl esterase/lipase